MITWTNNPYQDLKFKSTEPCNRASGSKLAAFLIEQVQNQNDVESICDLGCGNGYLAAQLAKLGYNVTGLDASPSGIGLARRHFIMNNVEFIQTFISPDAIKEVIGNRKFDLVVSSDVIEHLYRPSDLFESASLLLQKGGHLIICTPYHGYLKNLVLSVFDKWDRHFSVGWNGGHIKFFSVKTLEFMNLDHGYSDLKFHFWGRVPYLWKNMISHARKNR